MDVSRPWPKGMEPEPGARVLDTGAARFWLGEDGVMYNQALVDGEVGRRDLERGFAAILELTGGQPAVLVAEAGSMSSTTHEAREYMASPEAGRAIAAMAVVVTSPVARVIMKLFLAWAPPPYSAKLFASVDAAREWAREVVKRRSGGAAA